MHAIFTNWKTTVSGVFAGLAIVCDQLQYLFDSPQLGTSPDWNIVAAAVGIILAALFARDSDKSTEQSTGRVRGRRPYV